MYRKRRNYMYLCYDITNQFLPTAKYFAEKPGQGIIIRGATWYRFHHSLSIMRRFRSDASKLMRNSGKVKRMSSGPERLRMR